MRPVGRNIRRAREGCIVNVVEEAIEMFLGARFANERRRYRNYQVRARRGVADSNRPMPENLSSAAVVRHLPHIRGRSAIPHPRSANQKPPDRFDPHCLLPLPANTSSGLPPFESNLLPPPSKRIIPYCPGIPLRIHYRPKCLTARMSLSPSPSSL